MAIILLHYGHGHRRAGLIREAVCAFYGWNLFANTTLECFRGYADCVEGAVEKCVIIGDGVYEKGKISGHKAMLEAYVMEKKV